MKAPRLSLSSLRRLRLGALGVLETRNSRRFEVLRRPGSVPLCANRNINESQRASWSRLRGHCQGLSIRSLCIRSLFFDGIEKTFDGLLGPLS